ncbi:NAD(+) synthase [Commensalibacter papalotli (ex Botero et al. 2024)]|uniref:Glutamine-dependent NAD(+) synthetase n=1 Tax=Commensalibacter papalotli (ex Botero et al. 2024) TaxID=2972766 RepID=A0ABN8WEP9_9PROT|nr:NAD(+) synthase [Commensalibacter papalotli (ex Botero et al. 2024)]CAI3952747.1 NH3-dependent NAD+ synthetase (NadE) (PDB:3HMQ) [Commensalibacter papalotli (ex Botero et al. 2024)]CAI3953266.1 NH3-dependent NAD+ synthetase (NadE) (PDB:3HMQ) [Commensalibacter papalotli (ex Botero et al. 2024)]
MKNFYSIYEHNLLRGATCNFAVKLADPFANSQQIIQLANNVDKQGGGLCVFPELCLTGYSIEDLRLQQILLETTVKTLGKICQDTKELSPVLVLGAPLVFKGALYNCGIVMHKGKILGIVPKSFLPNYREFYEARQFISGQYIRQEEMNLLGQTVPFGIDLLFTAKDYPDFVLGVEICEDLWVPVPPSSHACMAGATVIANLSASNITIGKADKRTLLCQAQSARGICAYLYAAAGQGESSTDVAWDGQLSIIENGQVLAQSERFPEGQLCLVADIDLDILRQERLQMGSFHQNESARYQYRTVEFTLNPSLEDIGLKRPLERFPFVPSDAHRLEQDCYEAYMIQVSALKQRIQTIGAKRLVIGISGGLDSTQALLVAVQVVDELKMGRDSILGFTMPGFGTSSETKNNAEALMEALGIQWQCLDIRPAAEQMLKDMDHPYAKGQAVYDITFENVQAGLRTDYLFRLANHHNGIVIGTGDLSELALGWCTYGVGDQMSHYNVNGGLPKTLIQHLIRWVIQSERFCDQAGGILQRIIDTEISPELIPSQDNKTLQSTEEKIGPYALQDFNLYYILRYGLKPSKVAFLSYSIWSDIQKGTWLDGFPEEKKKAYALAEIRHWLEVFVNRFFAFSQFKRSAMPNSPKVSAGGGLSPRGDWRAPSDGNATIWVNELLENVPEK